MVEAAIPDIPGVLGQFPQCHSRHDRRHDRPTIAATIAATSPLSPGIPFLVLSPEFYASP
ncbi:hypothetical protein [Prochlorothrix hollandica]|uniref:Uncharacterized protein n=1 Tax=Prochlorothrix hollandica PCC 9006 = CALU 1027 TaxID=317619 RepID=A0A0M2PU77_PROHO|nr:hypothetical protein [Prochlorothrix hollandica]KKI98667.1 hypothetical protein PROH_17585 [Prochlorothrix hollandica PCC 9006 = CALU 1027]